MNYTTLTLGDLLSSHNETIKRNAVSILKTLQKEEVKKIKVDSQKLADEIAFSLFASDRVKNLPNIEVKDELSNECSNCGDEDNKLADFISNGRTISLCENCLGDEFNSK